MFEIETAWEGANEDENLALALFNDRSANKKRHSNVLDKSKSISEHAFSKKRKRGKKKKKTASLNETTSTSNKTSVARSSKENQQEPMFSKQMKNDNGISDDKHIVTENLTNETLHSKCVNSHNAPVNNLQKRLLSSLESSRFRYINEQLYTKHSSEAAKLFEGDPQSFEVYHNGYQSQIKKWDVNPLQIILTWIKKRSSNLVIADFGCGEAWIAQKVKNKVHSFDLVALNKHVTVADICKVPLEDESVDVVILCLALMGTNLNEIIFEANRILKMKGILKVAEVASRFQGINSFIKAMKKYGFTVLKRNLEHTHFYMFDFQKRDEAKDMVLHNSYPGLQLKPCLYKKR